MAAPVPLTLLACALGAAAILVLRHAWALPARVPAWNALGWGLMAAGTIAAWRGDGAWGLAVAMLVATGTAFALLAHAGATTPPRPAKASNRRAGMLPQGGEPWRIGRRIATFLIVTLGGLVAAIGLGVAVRGAGVAAGWHESDANVLALFVVPVAWGVLATVLTMQARRRAQLATLAACGAAVLPILLAGGA